MLSAVQTNQPIRVALQVSIKLLLLGMSFDDAFSANPLNIVVYLILYILRTLY